jgi:hypothetical protein
MQRRDYGRVSRFACEPTICYGLAAAKTAAPIGSPFGLSLRVDDKRTDRRI